MVEANGYLKLIDFGSAKIIGINDKTYTLMGSLHYIAPEVLDGRGHNFLADIYSLGVIFYELICGNLPFDYEQDPIKVYESIMSKKVEFPEHVEDAIAKKFIRNLMKRSPSKRMKYDFEYIRNSKVFDGIDFVTSFQFLVLTLICRNH